MKFLATPLVGSINSMTAKPNERFCSTKSSARSLTNLIVSLYRKKPFESFLQHTRKVARLSPRGVDESPLQ